MSEYEVYAIRYSKLEERMKSQNFLLHDLHDGPMPLYFYVWVVKSATAAWVVDTGFDEKTALRRKRTVLRSVRDGLAAVGVDHAHVRDVILTHLHYDHAGNHDLFPQARFHLQSKEMHFCTSRCMCHHAIRHPYEADDIKHIVDRIFADQVEFHDGSEEIAPGLSVHLVGGHAKGLQVVRVRTRRGWVVLASDASHYYANINGDSPFPVVVDVDDMLAGYDTLRKLADSPDHIVPGHDPIVEAIYPTHDGIDGVFRLDLPPRPMP